MILSRLPDLPPLPETPANVEFRRNYIARWGTENTVLYGSASHAEYLTVAHPLSVKMAWGGRERYRVGHRSIDVADASYLVLNEGTEYSSLLDSPRPMHSLAFFFRRGVAREASAAHRATAGEALERAPAAAPAADFHQSLRRHDAVVTPLLRRLHLAVTSGNADQAWLDEYAELLLAALLDAESLEQRRADVLPAAKASTRQELARRLRCGADFIEAQHTQPLDIASAAEAACLSRFHFIRYFKALYGTTPYAYLTACRATTARRLQAAGRLSIDEVALRSGFGSRSSMRRGMQRRHL